MPANDKQIIQLFDAIRENQIDKITNLLNEGVDIYALSPDSPPNTNVLMFAAMFGTPQLIRLLVSRGADRRTGLPMIEGVVGGVDNLRTLLELGGDPNQIDWGARTPLMEAVDWVDVDCVKLLMEKGADPFWELPGVSTNAMKMALALGNQSIIDLLMRKPA